MLKKLSVSQYEDIALNGLVKAGDVYIRVKEVVRKEESGEVTLILENGANSTFKLVSDKITKKEKALRDQSFEKLSIMLGDCSGYDVSLSGYFQNRFYKGYLVTLDAAKNCSKKSHVVHVRLPVVEGTDYEISCDSLSIHADEEGYQKFLTLLGSSGKKLRKVRFISADALKKSIENLKLTKEETFSAGSVVYKTSGKGVWYELSIEGDDTFVAESETPEARSVCCLKDEKELRQIARLLKSKVIKKKLSKRKKTKRSK